MAFSVLHAFRTNFYRISLRNSKKILSRENDNQIEKALFFCMFHLSANSFKRRKTAEERKAPRIIEYSPKSKRLDNVVEVWRNITVGELAEVMKKDIDHIFQVILHVENTSQYTHSDSVIDNPHTIYEILKKSGFRYKIIAKPGSNSNSEEEKDQDVVRQPPPDSSSLKRRCPVVTVMGHVDHGKTTLLDSLRNTSVVASEFGGITQHIGAFLVTLKSGDKITFLDTPGHAAFSAMRERGANVTDLVVLVVAADDGVMEQTVESIRMAKQANVPIIVAINKIDKPDADIERTKKMLMQQGIQIEDYGGDVQAVPISALKGTNLDTLTEAIVLQSEIMDLKGDPNGLVEGVIIESKVDSRRGKLSTSIIQRGTLRKGCVLVAGNAWAKVRAMFNHDGQIMNEAPPSYPVEIIGWRELPSAGDEMLEVESERKAHNVMRFREAKRLEEKQKLDLEVVKQKIDEHLANYRKQLEQKRRLGRYRLKPSGPRQKEIQDDDPTPRINLLIKGDVDGSIEAILDVLETYDDHKNCKLDLIHYGVGNVTESDVELAEIFNATIYGFNVECPNKIIQLTKSKKIPYKIHNVIYKLVDDIKEQLSAKLPPMQKEEIIGEANVLQQFTITEGKKKVPVAGCRCTKGMLKKSALYRVVRNNDTICEGTLDSMRHLKAEIDTIKKDTECGLLFKEKDIAFQPGDTIICYKLVEVPQTTSWNPGF